MTRVLRRTATLAIAMVLANMPAKPVDAFTLPAGSTLRVRLGTSLSSKEAQTGDQFTGDVAEPIISGGEEVVPTGSTVEGRVFVTRQTGRGKRAAELRLAVDSITTASGIRYSIVENSGTAGRAEAKDSAKSKADNNKDISEREQDPLYATVTATANSGVRGVLKKHEEIEVSPGTEFDFVAKRNVTLKGTTDFGDRK